MCVKLSVREILISLVYSNARASFLILFGGLFRMAKIYRTNFSSPAALNDLARLKLDHETKYNRETEETSLRREFLISIVVIASINSDGFNVSFFFYIRRKNCLTSLRGRSTFAGLRRPGGSLEGRLKVIHHIAKVQHRRGMRARLTSRWRRWRRRRMTIR